MNEIEETERTIPGGVTSAPLCRRHDSKSNIFSDVVFDLLSIGYKVCFRAGGRSMNPTVREGERIIVAPVAPSQLRVGDIVLYRNHRGVIAHRVVTIEKREGDARVFILRGDASRSCDAPVESRQILGKVVSVERNGRRMNVASRRAKMARKVRGCVSRLKAWCRGVGILRPQRI